MNIYYYIYNFIIYIYVCYKIKLYLLSMLYVTCYYMLTFSPICVSFFPLGSKFEDLRLSKLSHALVRTETMVEKGDYEDPNSSPIDLSLRATFGADYEVLNLNF